MAMKACPVSNIEHLCVPALPIHLAFLLDAVHSKQCRQEKTVPIWRSSQVLPIEDTSPPIDEDEAYEQLMEFYALLASRAPEPQPAAGDECIHSPKYCMSRVIAYFAM